MNEIKKNDQIVAQPAQQSLIQDACTIIDQAQATAYRQVNETLIKRNWLLGMRIQHEVLKEKRAEYGQQVVKDLAKELTAKYGEGFTWRNLYNYVDFYATYNGFFLNEKGDSVNAQTILHALSAKSENIFHALRAKSTIKLTWTHYRIILQENSKEARDWYEQETAREMWGTRTLQRNVSSQYYHRLLQSQNKDAVRDEMKQLTAPLQDKLEYLKNPVVAEFLGFKNNTDYTESDLEQSIIDHLIPFLMEMGKGFTLADRQKRIHTEKEDYYIDLVFYNYNLRCFVLVDLKTTKLRHQDVGQMDMYVRMYDEMMCPQGHNPTIGILLCADTDEDVAHYSVLNGSDQLYAAKYLTYMPTKEELRREIEQQKQFFLMQQDNNRKK
ncbi:YhcG family protein [Prevotella sp. P6B4]|uniref:PDDEXK nuclease domain-containing protein n=1 Tax=Prevotella sp. P6B4 TaxID=1410614 RepID=UPI00048D75C1|nr:PDDEXK nuclease domain-containing protein [Prevotella sp. P6B4]